MLPNIEQENKKAGKPKLTAEQRDDILVKVLASINMESMKPVSDTSVSRIVSSFAKSMELTNKNLIEHLVDEDKELLKEVVKQISGLQGKNTEELKRLSELAEKIMLSGDKTGNQDFKKLGEQLKDSILQEKYKEANATLTGDQDTFKNRFMRDMTGKTPAEGQIQGKSIFGSFLKDFSYGFRKGLGRSFVTDEERRERIREKAEYENKKVALAQSSAEDFGKILDSANNNSPDQEKFDVGGGEETTNLANPNSKIDAATRSDAEELRSGIRETDPAFSRSATDAMDPWEVRWNDLMDMLNKIKDCVCSCQCTGEGQVPEIDLPGGKPRPQRRIRGRGTGIIAAGAAAAAGLAAGAVGAYNWAKGKLGFGESTVATPESMPGTRTNPNTPATEITRRRPNTSAPKGLPEPANDRGVKIPTPANDDEPFVKEQKKVVNEKQWSSNEETTKNETPETSKTRGTVETTKPRTPPPVAANDVPAQKPKGGFWSNALDKIKGFTGFGKTGEKAAEKTAGKVVGKSSLKSLLKKVPVISLAAGGLFAAQRYMAGDKVGAGMELASGVAGTFPGAGTAASVGIDAALAARDMGVIGNSSQQPTAPTAPGSSATPAASKVAAGSAVAAPSAMSKVGSFLKSSGSTLRKGLGTAGRVLGKVAVPLAAGMAAYDAYKGFNADENATTGQKFLNAGRNVASGLTFGLIDSTEDKIASGEYTGSQAKTAGLETGRNLDGAVIERGTDMTAKSAAPVINVPPPTVIQAPASGQQSPIFGTGRDYINARPTDSTWLRFQEKRAVA